MVKHRHNPPAESLWYKDAVVYEVHIKAFRDSSGDGIGDFRGLIEKLDYLQDLGITAVWLLPFFPSPFKDDGYDIADYQSVHPDYGTLRDFKEFLSEAHRRGIRVIIELVLNHTSDQHPWFERARKAPPSSHWRDFYVWNNSPDKFKDARIIFKDFESSNWNWDPQAEAYYWHRFYSHQPDLNYENPEVQQAVFQLVDFWLDMGIDGLRLDAVPYLYEQEGTNCENLPQTHDFLKKLRRHVDERYPARMLLAEANQWPEDAAAYFGRGDECQMCFHFPLMPRLFMAIKMEDRFPIIDILEQTPEIPPECQWALFIRNHDELTLEMVTDEERDYMYRVYASEKTARINLGIRRRLAPLLDNDRRKIEIINVLLFSLPGTPIIYYGDEIGMGDNYYLGDRNGVRTPMQWSMDRNAGFSSANPQKLYLPAVIDPQYHYETVNVETQRHNPSSQWWWMKKLISARRDYRAFSRGDIKFLTPDNAKVLAFIRGYADEMILVIINLSRYAQAAALDLSEYKGYFLQDLFGGASFPAVGNSSYQITLPGHGYYWLAFSRHKTEDAASKERSIAEIGKFKSWSEIFKDEGKNRLLDILPDYLSGYRWFGGKNRRIHTVKLAETAALAESRLLILEVIYNDGAAEHYLLPLSFSAGSAAGKLTRENRGAVIARLTAGGENGVIYDAVYDPVFRQALPELIWKQRNRRGRSPKPLSATAGDKLSDLVSGPKIFQNSELLRADQSNTSIAYDRKLIFKIYRRLDPGPNPEMELNQYLSESGFDQAAPYAGVVSCESSGEEPYVVGILLGWIEHESDGWHYLKDNLSAFLEKAVARPEEIERASSPSALSIDLSAAVADKSPGCRSLIGDLCLEMVFKLGSRTAQMHLALAEPGQNPDFSPEPFSLLWQRSRFQSMRSLAKKTITAAKKLQTTDPEETDLLRQFLEREKEIIEAFRGFTRRKFSATKTRIHGNYHLGEVLFTGNDFYIIDFEGEPMRPVSDRRLKKSPLVDIAGMLRSFHYAANDALLNTTIDHTVKPEVSELLEQAAELWYREAVSNFLNGYFDAAGKAAFLPSDNSEKEEMLYIYLLEKEAYEFYHEIQYNPGLISLPLRGILKTLDEIASRTVKQS